MYRWRRLTPEERDDLLTWRKQSRHPWHRPPHPRDMGGCFHLTAACFEHAPHIGTSVKRMEQFSDDLLQTLAERKALVHAWCVLPNHYHLLVTVKELFPCLHSLGRLHGRSSHAWNGEDAQRGRKVWCPTADRAAQEPVRCARSRA